MNNQNRGDTGQMEKSYIIIYNIPVDRLEENLKNNNINRYIILNNTIVALYVDDSFNEDILDRIDGIIWWERSSVMSSLIELTNNLPNGETVRTAAGTEYIYKNIYNTNGKRYYYCYNRLWNKLFTSRFYKIR